MTGDGIHFSKNSDGLLFSKNGVGLPISKNGDGLLVSKNGDGWTLCWETLIALSMLNVYLVKE